jgi:hypothetical protein
MCYLLGEQNFMSMFQRIQKYIAVLITVAAQTTMAQTPEWVNEQLRIQNYPSTVYRTGFFSEAKVQETEQALSKLKNLAKSELIESIQVSIKSQSTLKIEEGKGNYNELFVSETVSLTEQDIVGLETLTYYDRKQKRASAFAFVKIQTLRDYYGAIIFTRCEAIQQNLRDIQTRFDSGNLNGVIDGIAEIRSDLTKVAHAQSVLLALGIKDNDFLKTEIFNSSQGLVAELQFNVLNDHRLTPENLIHFFAVSIKQKMGLAQGKIKVDKFSYDHYQLYSPFSDYLTTQLASEISALTNLSVVSENADYLISGTFREKANQVELEVTLKKAKMNEVISSFQNSFPKQNVQGNKADLLPLQIKKRNALITMSLTSKMNILSVKCNEQIDVVYLVKASVQNQDDWTREVRELPVNFFLNFSKMQTTLMADKDDSFAYVLHSVPSPKKVQSLNAQVNVPAYLDMDSTSIDYKRMMQNVAIPKIRLQLVVTGNILLISSSESNIGKELSTTYLRAGIIDALTKVGFEITQSTAKADYSIVIKADTRAGSSFEGLFFSYLDASVTLVDLAKENEVFSNQYRDIKAAGGSFEAAGVKAYTIGLNKIKDDLAAFFTK